MVDPPVLILQRKKKRTFNEMCEAFFLFLTVNPCHNFDGRALIKLKMTTFWSVVGQRG